MRLYYNLNRSKKVCYKGIDSCCMVGRVRVLGGWCSRYMLIMRLDSGYDRYVRGVCIICNSSTQNTHQLPLLPGQTHHKLIS